MILLINKDDVDRMTYWITRRFYLSMLFEIDTYLDTHGIEHKKPEEKTFATQPKALESKVPNNTNAAANDKVLPQNNDPIDKFYEGHYLLESISLSLLPDKEQFILQFKTKTSLSQTVMNKKDLLGFYHLMKKTFPKGEWGII